MVMILVHYYMDDGYLFFQVTPVEKKIEYDSVDLEIKVYEGKQARIKKVNVNGNTKTSDHVIFEICIPILETYFQEMP